MNTVYIFIGPSGSGKGTQVKLLEQKIKTLDPSMQTLLLQTGNKFRNLIESTSFTAVKVKETAASGKLPPAFIGVHLWANSLIQEYTGEGVVFIDGTPRVPEEVPLLLSAIAFYEWRAIVINIGVSDEWSYDHIKRRGRADDTNEEEVWGRIQWFHESVEGSIALLRADDSVTTYDINGEQTIGEVHADICSSIGL